MDVRNTPATQHVYDYVHVYRLQGNEGETHVNKFKVISGYRFKNSSHELTRIHDFK